jgi:dethiobiotin synthetase
MEKRDNIETFAAYAPGQEPVHSSARSALTEGSRIAWPLKWSWACRYLDRHEWAQTYSLCRDGVTDPRPADVALVQVEKLGWHRHLETDEARRIRLYEGDKLLCAFGDRYASEGFEGRVLSPAKHRLHMLTSSGMVGTVLSRHHNVKHPTTVSFLGYLTDNSGLRVNLKALQFQTLQFQDAPASAAIDVIAIAGTGMSTGKTTVMRRLLRGLHARGVRVAGCKLTGSTSPRDLQEMRATGSVLATDFSDYGFPSTYCASYADLLRLFYSMVNACRRAGAELILMELADGFLQPETQMILTSDEFRRHFRAVIVTATCSGSALCVTEAMQAAGHDVWAVSGLVTNAPLSVREFSLRSEIPVVSSHSADQLADMVMGKLAIADFDERPSVVGR